MSVGYEVGLKHFAWLAKYARGFPVAGDNVVILQTPSDYFQSIKVCARDLHHLVNKYFSTGCNN